MSGGGGIIIIDGRDSNNQPVAGRQESVTNSQIVANILKASAIPAVQAWGNDLQAVINEVSL